MRQRRDEAERYGPGPIRNKIRQGIAKGISRLAKIEGTSFWAHQFSEHFQFILDILKAEKSTVPTTFELRAKLKAMQARWALISDDPLLYKEADLVKTLELKEEVKSLVSGLDCIPDLITHMIEEVDYFKNSILADEYTLKDEVAWWATEHAENLDFVNCQLPILIQKEGEDVLSLGDSDELPAFLYKAFAANEDLSKQFKEVAYANQEGFLAGIGKALGLAGSSDINRKDLTHFLLLKAEHLNGIDGLIQRIPELPLDGSTMEELFKMLNHERNEAIFALNRIASYPNAKIEIISQFGGRT